MENYIGTRLSQARKTNKLTQEQFSEIIGMSVSEISRIETGKILPSIDILLKFCEVLDISLDFVLYDYFPKDTLVKHPFIQQINLLLEPMNDRSLELVLNCLTLYVDSLNKI